MSYKDIYDKCQNFPIPVYDIARHDYINLDRDLKIEEQNTLAGDPYHCETIKKMVEADVGFNIDYRFLELENELLLGFYLSPKSTSKEEFHYSEDGGALVLVSIDMNPCWKRLVCIKEFMHAFDTEEQKASTAKDLEEIINTLTNDAKTNLEKLTPVVASEFTTIIMALGLLCPKKHINQFREELMIGAKTNYDVALAFRIPEQYVPTIMDPAFDNIIKSILDR